MKYADLDPIERAIFDLLVEDYAINVIAARLDLTYIDVQCYIASIRRKLQA